ncbi:hypothetical protein BDN72DRAFT_17139 [Pluteus cervinus]|uniref:Uncharacterized protein n=1 Tax=Pluteus cervinus TaxID=181527 RepID=A0ACD3BGZ6_9AGAR|nr:hypothetical protein BDN72DRAFT_17139 [Pluteus cervinus]
MESLFLFFFGHLSFNHFFLLFSRRCGRRPLVDLLNDLGDGDGVITCILYATGKGWLGCMVERRIANR